MLKKIVDGRTDLVFEYVSAGNPAHSTDADGVPILRWCAYYGDVSAVRFLLGLGENLKTLGRNFDLNAAAFHGHWQLCEFLIENGADPNVGLPQTGETSLHSALCAANRLSAVSVVKVLLAAGADVNRATQAVAETGSFMRDCRTRAETPLHRAAAFGSEEVIDLLLEAGAAKNARDINGDTPLSWASWHLRPASVLRKLCFGDFSIHPAANWTGDHGIGWSGMDIGLSGKPRD